MRQQCKFLQLHCKARRCVFGLCHVSFGMMSDVSFHALEAFSITFQKKKKESPSTWRETSDIVPNNPKNTPESYVHNCCWIWLGVDFKQHVWSAWNDASARLFKVISYARDACIELCTWGSIIFRFLQIVSLIQHFDFWSKHNGINEREQMRTQTGRSYQRDRTDYRLKPSRWLNLWRCESLDSSCSANPSVTMILTMQTFYYDVHWCCPANRTTVFPPEMKQYNWQYYLGFHIMKMQPHFTIIQLVGTQPLFPGLHFTSSICLNKRTFEGFDSSLVSTSCHIFISVICRSREGKKNVASFVNCIRLGCFLWGLNSASGNLQTPSDLETSSLKYFSVIYPHRKKRMKENWFALSSKTYYCATQCIILVEWKVFGPCLLMYGQFCLHAAEGKRFIGECVIVIKKCYLQHSRLFYIALKDIG